MLFLVLIIGDRRETVKTSETSDIWNDLKCPVRQFVIMSEFRCLLVTAYLIVVRTKMRGREK